MSEKPEFDVSDFLFVYFKDWSCLGKIMNEYVYACNACPKKKFQSWWDKLFSSVPKRVLGAHQLSYLADKHGKKLQIEVVHRDLDHFVSLSEELFLFLFWIWTVRSLRKWLAVHNQNK